MIKLKGGEKMQKEFKRCPKLIVTTEGKIIGSTGKELKFYERTTMKGEPYLYLQYQNSNLNIFYNYLI